MPFTNFLYVLADRGLLNLIRIRLEITLGDSRGGGRYRYPLLAVIAKGNKDSIIALLGLLLCIYNGIDIIDGLKCKVDLVQKDYMPFSWAYEEGYKAITKVLL
ncbi:unnamed protein product [Fusarium graminearum]|nr:unnamed protein product [Fusarium graminearum]